MRVTASTSRYPAQSTFESAMRRLNFDACECCLIMHIRTRQSFDWHPMNADSRRPAVRDWRHLRTGLANDNTELDTEIDRDREIER